MFDYYIYIYLNPLKVGTYVFGKLSFDYEPFYIGKGRNNRHKHHLLVIDKQNKLKQNILNKIKNNNKEPIIIKLYENITEYTAFRLEKYLIKLIGRRDYKTGPLSNLTNGGEGSTGIIYTSEIRNNMLREKRKIVQYNTEGKILNIWSNMVELSIEYPYLLTNHIHRACGSNGHRKIDNYLWKYYDNEKTTDTINIIDKYKPILQYDLDGNFIKEWNSSNEINNIGYPSGAVLKCCRNNQNKSLYYKFKKFIWLFKYSEIKHNIHPYKECMAVGNSKLKNKNIKMYNINNEFLGVFNPKELKNNGFYTKTIYRCCNKELKTTQGFKWEWL